MFSHGGCMAVKRAIDAGDIINTGHPLYNGVREVIDYVEANGRGCCGAAECECAETATKEVG